MRSWLLAFLCLAVLTCAATYRLTLRSPQPEQSPIATDQAESTPVAQNPDHLSNEDEGAPEGEGALEKESSPAIVESKEPSGADEKVAIQEAPEKDVRELAVRTKTKPNLSWLALYAYSELPPETKPADTILDALKDDPPGTPIEEIKRVADILGLDFTFMKTVAKIESSFNPKARTGSYIGLFQVSNYEFGKFGSGDILDSRDNTIAAALKIMTEATLFEMFTHRKTTLNDLYLIHQQGVDGAAEHLRHPSRLAWKSMCATEEGKRKGEKWCKRAIWGNTLPTIKRAFKSVNKITSAAFVDMWQQRLSQFYARYSEVSVN